MTNADKIWEQLEEGEHFTEGEVGVRLSNETVLLVDSLEHFHNYEKRMDLQFHHIDGYQYHSFPIEKTAEVVRAMEDVYEHAVADDMEVLASPGVERIARERRRQQAKEGWDVHHDDKHVESELSRAAACYAVTGTGAVAVDQAGDIDEEFNVKNWAWPWKHAWWKPSEDRIRNLEKAGALIAAEIDRLLRCREKEEEEENVL